MCGGVANEIQCRIFLILMEVRDLMASVTKLVLPSRFIIMWSLGSDGTATVETSMACELVYSLAMLKLWLSLSITHHFLVRLPR